MKKTDNRKYNRKANRDLNMEMDLWIAFKDVGGKAFTVTKRDLVRVGNYINGQFISTGDKEKVTELFINFVPNDSRGKLFHVVYKGLIEMQHQYNDSFETIAQAKRYITKCFGSGAVYLKHF